MLGYSRAITLVLAYGGDSIVSGSELQLCLVLLVVSGSIAGIVGMYLHAVVPDIDGTRASIFFFTRWCCRPEAKVGLEERAVPLLVRRWHHDQ